MAKTNKQKKNGEATLELSRGWKHSEEHARDTNVKDNSGAIPDRNKELVTGNQREGDLCYKLIENFTELSCSLLWKIELVSIEIRYLTEKISKPSVEGPTLFLLAAYSKMWKRRNELRRNYQAKRHSNLKIWKFLSLSVGEREREHARKSNDTVSLNLREWRQDEMKEGCGTSWIWQERMRAIQLWINSVI